MSVTSVLFPLLIVGSFVAMFSMHRSNASAPGGMGGCCGGHGSHDHQNEQAPGDGDKPPLGPPGTSPKESAPAAAHAGRHRGC